jgi:hypothetical protein
MFRIMGSVKVKAGGKANEKCMELVERCESRVLNTLGLDLDLTVELDSAGVEDFDAMTVFDDNKATIKLNCRSKLIQYVLRLEDALVGLLAHETVHVIEKSHGLDEYVANFAKKKMQVFVDEMDELAELTGQSRELIFASLMELMLTLGFVLKDFAVNRKLIELGFGSYLAKYYKALVNSKLEGETAEMGFGAVSDYFLALLSLTPAWIPLYKAGMKSEAVEIRNLIFERFSEIPGGIRIQGDTVMGEFIKMEDPPTEKDVGRVAKELITRYKSSLRAF